MYFVFLERAFLSKNLKEVIEDITNFLEQAKAQAQVLVKRPLFYVTLFFSVKFEYLMICILGVIKKSKIK